MVSLPLNPNLEDQELLFAWSLTLDQSTLVRTARSLALGIIKKLKLHHHVKVIVRGEDCTVTYHN